MKKDNQLANQIKKLHYQLSFSEHTNKELANQLTQSQLINPLKTISQNNQYCPIINAQQHLQELFYVEPLLMAYQHKIQLLDEQLRQLKEDSISLVSFGEQIIAENNFLRKELQTKNQMILKSQHIGLNVNFLKLDNENLLEKNSILKQQNSFLSGRIHEMEELNEGERTKNSRPNANLNEIMKELRVQKEKSKNYELEIIQAQNINELTANSLNNEKSIHQELQRKNQLLQSELYKAKNQAKIVRQQFQSYQIGHEATTNTLNLQIQSLKKQLSAIQRREQELFAKNMALESQLQDKDSKTHNLTLQNAQLQANNHNILQMLETYEGKVSSQSKKIKQLQSEIKDYGESLSVQRKQCEMSEWKLREREKEMKKKEQQWLKERNRKDAIWQQRLQSTKRLMVEQKQQLLKEINRLKMSKEKFDI